VHFLHVGSRMHRLPRGEAIQQSMINDSPCAYISVARPSACCRKTWKVISETAKQQSIERQQHVLTDQQGSLFRPLIYAIGEDNNKDGSEEDGRRNRRRYSLPSYIQGSLALLSPSLSEKASPFLPSLSLAPQGQRYLSLTPLPSSRISSSFFTNFKLA
jgi:hypothetical protein